MNRDIIRGKWNQLKGSFKQQWGKLVDDDINYVSGSFDKLIGKVQERYGRHKEEQKKEHELEEALSSFDKNNNGVDKKS